VGGWSRAEGPLAFGIRAEGPESNQPWACIRLACKKSITKNIFAKKTGAFAMVVL
jgi:hypothetical protein